MERVLGRIGRGAGAAQRPGRAGRAKTPPSEVETAVSCMAA